MTSKIALVQFPVKLYQDFTFLSSRVEKYLRQANKANCRMICFPEDFWFGPLDYYQPDEIVRIINNQTPEILNWLCGKAKEYQLNVIAGTFIEKIGSRFFNVSTVFSENGEIIYKYQKQNLVPFGFEKNHVRKGISSHIFKIAGIKIGLLICRDLFYPEIMQKLRRQGAEIVFVPSFWPKRSNDYQKHQLVNTYHFLTEHKTVDALCQARSYENELAVLYVNASGHLKSKDQFDVLLGRTQTCLPFYGCTSKLHQNKEGVLIFAYDRNVILDARKAYQL